GGASGASSGHSAAAAAAAAASALCSGGLPDRPCQFYRVQVMGAPRVGKSTLCSQFMSSESQVTQRMNRCRRSFGFAKQIFNDLVSEARKSAALILVANKSDLVRNRDVTHDEAKNLASVYGAKYIEISTALNHNVDELLVSILSQIRVQLKRIEKEKCKLLSRQKDGRGLRASLRLRSPRQALGNFFRKHFSSKSCEDLEPPNQQAQ
uniref:Small monomeric GTPase n=1 Tax=Macrostomum lignano TaxID=282301 RepID=A0A1I8ISS9_9PLAT